MIENLKQALHRLLDVKQLFNHALSPQYYPAIHDNTLTLIRDVRELIAALERGEKLQQ